MGIKIDFYPIIYKEDPFTLVFLDTTRLEIPTSFNISSLTFTLQSPYISDGIFNLDVLPYLSAYQADKEWLRVTSDMLGVDEGQPIPDGAYTASFVVDNTYTTTHTFMVYQNFKYEVQQLVADSGFKIDLMETNLAYQNSDKYDFEKMAMVTTLLATLEQSMLDGDIVAAEEALSKGKAILQLIGNQYDILK